MQSSKLLIVFLVVLTVGTLFYFGFQDKQDPFWDELDTLLVKDYQTLDKSAVELQELYHGIHEKDEFANISALGLISEPFLPTMELSKYQKHFHHLKTHRFALVAGVTGVGNYNIN